MKVQYLPAVASGTHKLQGTAAMTGTFHKYLLLLSLLQIIMQWQEAKLQSVYTTDGSADWPLSQ